MSPGQTRSSGGDAIPAGDEAMFRRLVENLDLSYFRASRDYGRFFYLSPAADRVWGRPASCLLAEPHRWLEWLHPEDRPGIERFLAENEQTERYEREFRIVFPDGGVRWLQTHVFPGPEADGVPTVIGYHQDVTALKEQEDRLRRSHETYCAIQAATTDGFWEVSTDGRILGINQAYVRQSGYSREELLSMSIADLEAVETAADVARHAQRVVETGGDRFETKHRRKDGSVWDVEVSTIFRPQGAGCFYAFLRDVSERKRLQESLTAERDLNQRYLDTVEAIIVALDSQGAITLINRKGCALLGYAQDELIGQPWFERCLPQPEGLDMIYPVFRQIMAGEMAGLEYVENEILTRTGERRLIAWHNASFHDETGAIVGSLSAGEDITERKRDADRIIASERRFRDLVNTTDGIVWEADARDFRFTFVSDKAERLLGFPTDEWLQPGFWVEHLHPDDRVWAPSFCLDSTARLEPHSFEYRFIARDGRVVWLKDVVTVVSEDGRPRWLRGIMVDISEVKETEQGLQLARQIFDTAGEAIFVSDLDGNLLDVNPEACRLAKYTRDEMLRLRNVDIVAPEDVSRIAPELDQADHGAVLENRWLLLCSDKSTVPLDLVVQRLPGDRYLAIGRDLTEREKALREIARARDVAEAASVAKSRFLAAASHDLRQPIQAINLLRDALDRTGLTTEQQRISDALASSVQNLSELLNALLDISKLESGMFRPQPEILLSTAVFTRIDTDFSAIAADRGLRFKLCFPFGDLPLYSDANLLHTLLGNLIGNALKYTDRGGVLVGIRRRGNMALFQVWDTGVGIPPEHLERIFDEYYQVGNFPRDRSKGLGLGLAIVSRIARLLDTRVVCRSRPGRGSVFEFRLPIAAAPVVPARPMAPVLTDRRPSLAGKRIAVIDDDRTVVNAISMALESLGLTVIDYPSAESALADPCILAADFVISDFRLPGINGIDCLDALRQRSPRCLQGLLLTGDTSPERIELFRQSGWPVLFKPVSLPGLIGTLESLAVQNAGVAAEVAGDRQ